MLEPELTRAVAGVVQGPAGLGVDEEDFTAVDLLNAGGQPQSGIGLARAGRSDQANENRDLLASGGAYLEGAGHAPISIGLRVSSVMARSSQDVRSQDFGVAV